MIDLPAALRSIDDAIAIADLEIARLERRIDAALRRRARLLNEQVVLLTVMDESLATVEPTAGRSGEVRGEANDPLPRSRMINPATGRSGIP